MKIKTTSFLNSDGVKCWRIRRGDDQPVIAVPAPTNKSKYVVFESDTPKTLKEIKQDVLDGNHDHFADAQPCPADSPQEAPRSLWTNCVPAASLLALLASGWSLEALEKEIKETLDNEGLLVDGDPDETTASAVYHHHRQNRIRDHHRRG